MSIDVYNYTETPVSDWPAEFMAVIDGLNSMDFDPEYYTADDLSATKRTACMASLPDPEEYVVSHFADRLRACIIFKSTENKFYLRNTWDGMDTLIEPSTPEQAIAEMAAMMAP
jgi:hypothetical protein